MGKGSVLRCKCELSPYQMKLCRMFAEESAETQQRIEFGSKQTLERKVREIVRDTEIGKRAEAAVCNIFHGNGCWDAAVNYEVFPDGVGDGCDLTVNGWTMDVKSTRRGKYLMYEEKRANDRKRSNTLPDFLVFCWTPWDREQDKPDGNYVYVMGGIRSDDLMVRERLRKAGDVIPGTQTPLQATNYVVSMDELQSFGEIVNWIMTHKKGVYNAEKQSA